MPRLSAAPSLTAKAARVSQLALVVTDGRYRPGGRGVERSAPRVGATVKQPRGRTEVRSALPQLRRGFPAGAEGEGHLEALPLRDNWTDTTETVPASALFVLIGPDPHTDWLPTAVQRD